MADRKHDPRPEAERARADLKRNQEIGTAVPQSPITRQPSVTPKTFGEGSEKARSRSGTDEGLEAGGPPRGKASGGGSESIAEAEQVTAGRDRTRPVPASADDDVLSRAKE